MSTADNPTVYATRYTAKTRMLPNTQAIIKNDSFFHFFSIIVSKLNTVIDYFRFDYRSHASDDRALINNRLTTIILY